MKNDLKSCSFPATRRISYYVAFGIFIVLSFEGEEGLLSTPFFIFQVKPCYLGYLCYVHVTTVKRNGRSNKHFSFATSLDTVWFAHVSPSMLFRGSCICLILKHKLLF